MNSTFDPLVGQVLDGRYEIVAKVARGGMATVYRARDRRLSRVVAVKVMRSDLGEDDEFAAKFDREARSAALLSHPSVVSIFDQGSSQGKPYIVMEFIEGETMRRMISRDSPMPPDRALELFEQVAAALAAAHEAGVVHRDIKPENVMITRRGQVKVADFGLARQVGSPQMTATGILVGTASYLPPELVTHSRPDGRSDVYSAGVVLFELLTGKKPHTGENNYQIAYRHVNVDIERPSERLAEIGHSADWEIPDYLDTLVLAATRRDPRARISDGRELLSAVRRARRELARTGGHDNPTLAAALLPESPAEDETEHLRTRSSERPRPLSSGSPPTVVLRRDEWRPAQKKPRPDPVPVAEPVSPRPVATTTQPRSQRTPVFPHLHISDDPVHRRRRIVALVLVVLLLAGAAGVGSWWWLDGRFTTVPAMSTLNETKAREAAAANALKVNRTEQYSETVPAGVVITTDPTAGERLFRGSDVTLVLSKGPERYPMPAVVGIPLEAASQALTAGRLAVGTVTEQFSETVAEGIVLTASQEEGAQLKPDTPVDLSVSKGREPIRIPNHVGGSADKAVKDLEKLGFTVAIEEENSADVGAERVIRQDPRDGSGHRGDTVTLVKSLGPVMVTVPDVWMKSTDEATKLLEDLDLVVKVERSSNFPIPLDIANSTDPAAGTEVAVGTKITLYVA
ncbi:Stk1 family PASTA domain-containing Ser/Thr kinase [Tessaracoccus sp. MC1865]|uniref:Stk1 family PASTA domain-containing Ser/Thr kinase n=1 Tax=Tessaracoccus sp. MC1865 TaxID=2760310 RepID=UPI001600F1B1|nr:Stk1 family PASTA domain-containing Ser/Thr kinase [Tessaracoccus sp. MC1865]MBB1483621.1 Stk1 family PASTA domain-containing Ser/Thr kinase [Tessaracoccus sp. MC1865]QTO36700.1 Stk1 family PASTA domain-containing Ser/Thr kinase [Tessaracoccus sp. MC1865]